LHEVGDLFELNVKLRYQKANNKVTYYELNDANSTSGKRRVIFLVAATCRSSLGPTKCSDRKALSPILEQPEHETTHPFWCHPTLEHALNDALSHFHQSNKDSQITTCRQFCAYDDILKHAICLNYITYCKDLLINMYLSQLQCQSENEVDEMKS